MSKSRYKKKPKTPRIIIENEPEQSQMAKLISDFKHYLKTTEIPLKLRMGLLKSKLSEIVQEVDDFSVNAEMITTINAVFMHLYRTHHGSLKDIMSQEDIFKLYKKTVHSLPLSGSFELPEFILRLTQDFLQSEESIPDDTLVQIITLGSSLKFSEFKSILEYIVRNKKAFLSPTFTKSVLDYLIGRKELNLASFEAFLEVAAIRDVPLLISEDFCNAFMIYTEQLFEERNPRVHEYKELDKNIYRIQFVTSKVIEQAFSNLNMETALKLLKMKADLNSVVSTERDLLQVQKMFTILSENGKLSDFADIKAVIFKEDLFNDNLADTILLELVKQRELFSDMRTSLCEFINADDVKFTPSLRMKAELIKTIGNHTDLSELLLFATIESVYSHYTQLTDDLSSCYTDIVQVLMLSGCTEPSGELLQLLGEDFHKEYSFEPSIYSFKFRIDRGIEVEDHAIAYQIFEQSLKFGSVHWDQSGDPRISHTLNNLVILLCDKENSITEIFPKFRKIKQHMSTQANAEAINAMATRMLAEECVGDTIELLKRELPSIDKDSTIKLQVTHPWTYAYSELFETLHSFSISYNNEETHETNWVLYGELHKYFHVPYETYMSALKFFCKVDRLNAALVIFRQIKKLNELHGTHHHNLPPLRDMYMFLLKTFGERLYEEGVVEMHEYLNMDVNLPDQDIDLQNCILNAYSNLQSVGKVRDLFLSISSNAKQYGGINEETIQIMIKTYTYSDMLYVKKFWNNISQFGIFPDYNIFKQYLIAHVYHGLVDDAFALIDEIDDYNIKFSPDLLLAMHNYCLDSGKQQEIEKWAIENHKDEWETIKDSGLLKTASYYMPDTNLLTDGRK